MTLPPVLKKNNTDLNLWHVLVIFTGLMFAKIAGSFQEGRFNETLLGFSLNFLSARVGSCLNFLIRLPRSSADLILPFEISFSYKTTVNEDISRLTFVVLQPMSLLSPFLSLNTCTFASFAALLLVLVAKSCCLRIHQLSSEEFLIFNPQKRTKYLRKTEH